MNGPEIIKLKGRAVMNFDCSLHGLSPRSPTGCALIRGGTWGHWGAVLGCPRCDAHRAAFIPCTPRDRVPAAAAVWALLCRDTQAVTSCPCNPSVPRAAPPRPHPAAAPPKSGLLQAQGFGTLGWWHKEQSPGCHCSLGIPSHPKCHHPSELG